MRRPDGVASAEIGTVDDDNEGIPAVWILRLPVGDLKESLRRVRDGGGEILKESPDVQYAIIRDPVGVYFALQARE